MRRETKINWIVVILLVVGSVPGAVRVFYKYYNDESRRVALPEQEQRSVPYMVPVPTPMLQRKVPKQTGVWLRSVAKARLGDDAVAIHRMNADLTAETAAEAPGKRLEIAWDGELAARWIAGGAERVVLPEAIRHELQLEGFVKPPKAIAVRQQADATASD